MKEIITALAKCYTEVGYVQRKGKMDSGNTKYNYAKEQDFIAAIRPVMIENGLTLFPAKISSLHTENYPNKSGTPTNRVVAVFTFHLAHTSGETLEISALGEGVDTGDKASYKAATGALKYALRQSLIIETGDDPDDSLPEPKETEAERLQREAREALERSVQESVAKLNVATSLDDLAVTYMGLDAEMRKQAKVVTAKDARKAELSAVA